MTTRPRRPTTAGRNYSPLRSAVILTLSFLLPLLWHAYSDRLSEINVPALWRRSEGVVGESSLNATSPAPVFANQQTEDAARMLQDLRRDSGKWNSNHPRYRLLNSLKAYLRYGEERTADLDTWRKRYKKLSREQRSNLERTVGYTNKLNTVEALMIKNSGLAEDILSYGLKFYGVARLELDEFVEDTKNETNKQKGNTLYAVKHFVRDWSNEGLYERQTTYPCVLDAVRKEFPATSPSTPAKILVPGSGLGRLGHEIAALGDFEVTMNEFSYSMNIAYHYITTLSSVNASAIHPYIDWWSHRATTADLTRSVSFPDNISILSQPSISLIEGEFTTALKPHLGTYDALVSHFFIDTATNILTYLETIHAMLKPGGVWINFGPLLYGSMPTLQLSLDEVIAMAESLGFELEQPGEGCGRVMGFDSRVRGAHVPYAHDEESLNRNAYLAQHWVARKKK
ncbi:hypothetical protein WHR41_02862 [Cladosporium halotolerans]|uniref:N2227-domain-containing protein n=1 Tax=Cladosporium halotolerans TaxID=1052096 RepID=A0AB34KWY9_9PEZI